MLIVRANWRSTGQSPRSILRLERQKFLWVMGHAWLMFHSELFPLEEFIIGCFGWLQPSHINKYGTNRRPAKAFFLYLCAYSWALLSWTQSGLAQSVKIRHLVVEGFCVIVKQEALVSSQRVNVMLSPPYAIKAKCWTEDNIGPRLPEILIHEEGGPLKAKCRLQRTLGDKRHKMLWCRNIFHSST